ncbi:CRM-domain containing factor CFM9, mitochondrial isoform X2 [Cryptomeria japonica]|nr:CRM-domain containing factor CFM9, mitochondrial isoform X2 [Cryptomeria japonica]
MSGIRSRVEKRMRRETGRTLREIRRAKKLRKKLMTEEERLIFGLRRAKKKVALLLQKLKKYELPELPPPRHDPELLTPEQLQALKKIGFKNQNYVPVGVRGVFGGVVQNMHLHWKFHETVQVCCDTFPKEKIREMATMLARLSGGTVINIHNVKTIIMYRGRNYRQPKILIPINTLTKRKALFKARFEQALESQKINIKKIEQELRRRGVNPEDPVAMASVEKVASTFFRAIDEKQGTPYMFRGDKKQSDEIELQETQPPAEDSDQEELDRFIAEIEDAADEEWAAEEAAEKREMDQIRYWSRPVGSDDIPEKDMDSDMDSEEDVGSNRGWRNTDDRNRRGQRDNYDRSRSGNQVTLEGSRRIKDVVGDLDSDDEGTENGTTSSENEDWDIEDKVTDKIRGHRSDIDFGFDGDKERENASSRTKERMRNVQSNVMNRTASGKGRTRELENMDEDWMDEDWDSDDEVINEGRKEHKSSDDNQYTTDNLTDKRRGCKSDMYDHWSSDEDDEYNTKDGLMYMHEKNDTDGEDVARGRSKEIGGANGRDSKHKVVEINKRKKKLDENWDSD